MHEKDPRCVRHQQQPPQMLFRIAQSDWNQLLQHMNLRLPSLLRVNVIIADRRRRFNAKIMETKENHDADTTASVRGGRGYNKLRLSNTIGFLYWTNAGLYAMIEPYRIRRNLHETNQILWYFRDEIAMLPARIREMNRLFSGIPKCPLFPDAIQKSLAQSVQGIFANQLINIYAKA